MRGNAGDIAGGGLALPIVKTERSSVIGKHLLYAGSDSMDHCCAKIAGGSKWCFKRECREANYGIIKKVLVAEDLYILSIEQVYCLPWPYR